LPYKDKNELLNKSIKVAVSQELSCSHCTETYSA